MNFIYSAASEAGKKYRVAANGLLGEFLNFIWLSDLTELEKKEHFNSVAKFLN